MPVGSVITWSSANLPEWMTHGDYLECNGQSFDTSKYPRLYKGLGDNHVPDYRGVFLRGYGSHGDHHSDNIGSIQEDAMRRIYGDIPNLQFGAAWYGSYDLGVFDVNSGGPRPHGESWWRVDNVKTYRYKLVNNGENYSLIEEEQDKSYDVSANTDLWSNDASKKAFRTVTIDSSKTVPTADEVRPVNIAVRYFIKAR